MTEDRIIEKIRKLMALATSSNEHEAAAAAAKAQELLLKHNLDASQIAEEAEEDVVHVTHDDRWSDGWRSQLINGIAKATGCQIVQEQVYKWVEEKSRSLPYRRFHVFGKTASVEVVTYLYDYLNREIIRLSPTRANSRFTEVNAFRLGASLIIGRRLKEQYVQFREASDETRALVLVTDTAVTALKETDFPKLRKGRSSQPGDEAAFHAGAAAGRNVPLRQGVAGQHNAGGQHLLG